MQYGSQSRSVSVILPTIDRYAYLVPLLHQLASQSVLPSEVIVVDQTPREVRRDDLDQVAPGLNVMVIEQDVPGQSSARNSAIRVATGEFLLFIDDDDEIGPTLIADHLKYLPDGVDGSCGSVDDATAGPPPPGFRHRRAQDLFPTNNSMLRASALEMSGLFDVGFDGLPQEDHDLGMRLTLSGALLIYNPDVMVFHHHAPRGGLRVHKVRSVTRASSQRSVTQRNLPSVSSLALGYRYHSSRQVHESKLLRLMSGLFGEGPLSKRLIRMIVQLVLLPDTVRSMRHTSELAKVFPPPPKKMRSRGGIWGDAGDARDPETRYGREV